jgi:hypothetical protein
VLDFCNKISKINIAIYGKLTEEVDMSISASDLYSEGAKFESQPGQHQC